ncbi:Na+/H+ antiporter [Actinobacteria bacterium IMCC26256]|nr:Na+/H+ antiporter [Actinobacteria bacterium IMCC26256]
MPHAQLDRPRNFLERFVRVETRAAGLILGAAVIGVFIASMPFGAEFTHRLETSHLRSIISEVAVTGFFLLVGLELRREAAHGALSGTIARVCAFAAVAGMVVPAAIYLLLVRSPSTPGASSGWVAVVATDIAVATAIIAIAGGSSRSRTTHLRTMILTIAIFDDIGAVFALALFGSDTPNLFLVPLILGVIAAYAVLAKRLHLGGWAVAAVAATVCILSIQAGIHPSLAAFAVGCSVPRVKAAGTKEPIDERIERGWHPWIAGILLPLFVFVNTLVPVSLSSGSPAILIAFTAVAILLGKVIGVGGVLLVARKSIGISIGEAITLGIAAAAALTVAIIGVEATVAGTINAQPVSLGILLATLIAAVAGVAVGRATNPKRASSSTSLEA